MEAGLQEQMCGVESIKSQFIELLNIKTNVNLKTLVRRGRPYPLFFF